MKYKVVFLAAILLLALIPAVVGAQGYPAAGSFASLGLPSLGGLFGSRSCGSACDPGLGAGLAVEVGYVGYRRGVTFGFTEEQANANLIQDRRLNYPLEGIWLSPKFSVALGEGVGVYAKGSWLVPRNDTAYENYVFPNFAQAERQWSTRTQWYTVEAGGIFSPIGSLGVVAGFRFDDFMTTFKNPINVVNLNARTTDTAEVVTAAYIPYVGVQVSHGSSVRAGLIGFPWAFGTVRYTELLGGSPAQYETSGNLRNAYFLEAFADAGTQVMGGYAGLFAKWTYLHTASSLDFDRTQLNTGTIRVIPTEMTMDRANWVVGGELSLNFTSPM